MIRRSTWILLAVLAVLVGFSFYLKNQRVKQAAMASPTSSSSMLFLSTEGAPNDIKIEDGTGKSVEIARNASGAWVLKAPTEATADQGPAEAAATQVGALRSLGEVQLGLDIVGLAQPSYTITVSFTNGKTHKLEVGSVTPIQTGYYARLDGGTVQIAEKQGLDSLVSMLTNPPYPPTATPTVTATPEPQFSLSTPTPSQIAPAVTDTPTKSP
jgi:hypothetical protein